MRVHGVKRRNHEEGRLNRSTIRIDGRINVLYSIQKKQSSNEAGKFVRLNSQKAGKISKPKNVKQQSRERNKYPSTGNSKSNNEKPALTKKQLRRLATQQKAADAAAEKVPKKHKPQKREGIDFRDQLVDDLKSSRFRFINELLYTRPGHSASEIFKEDSQAFQTYHEGYRQQVAYWPINPLDRIIKSIKGL